MGRYHWSPLLLNFEANSTILRIASEREGKSL